MSKTSLSQNIKIVPDLTVHEIMDMYRLMADNYTEMSFENFTRDLKAKTVVLLLLDDQQTIQGFTTFVANPKMRGTEQFNILFSGDTIISPQYWGTMALINGWYQVVAQFLKTDLSKPWYWFLMSKGHRTYMYLPLFFERYYPALEPNRNAIELRSIAHTVASILYPKNWLPEAGVIRFEQSNGALTPKLAAGTYQRQHNAQVAFFLQKNPNFEAGDELVCISALNPENFRGSARTTMETLLKSH
jgi:hypothetical protein